MTAAPALVSVVLPAYNRAPVLPRAIASVLSQSYAHLEIIVVDDGSTDDTEAAVRAIGDPRVRYLRRENGGAGAARNTGIAAARGAFIAFQDSDDEWLPEKLAKQCARLAAAPDDVGVVVCGHLGSYGPDRVIEVTVDEPMQRGDAIGSLLTGLWYIPPTWLVRASVFERAGRFDEELPSAEDWDLAFRLADACRFDCIPEVLVRKHYTHGSVWDHSGGRIDGFRAVLERHRHRWRDAPAALARQEYYLGYWLLTEQRRHLAAWRYLWLAATHHPETQAKPARELFWWHLPRVARGVLRLVGFDPMAQR
jgi:glycosyltransferase involved in cell wall biosynthesis